MADYFHPRAHGRSDAAGYRVVALGGFVLAILAAAAWLWLRQPARDETLPSSEPASSEPASSQPVAADASVAADAPPIQPLAARPAPLPPSADVAAVGDTRPAQR